MGNHFAPKARRENLVVQELEGEVLIYDLDTDEAFGLNKTSTIIWQLCDGNNSISEISLLISRSFNSIADENFVWLALDQLKKKNLLENKDEIVVNFGGMSRREVIRKVGLASVTALPLISSLVAPQASSAQSRVCSATCVCTVTNVGAGVLCAPAGTCTGGCRCLKRNNGADSGGRCTV